MDEVNLTNAVHTHTHSSPLLAHVCWDQQLLSPGSTGIQKELLQANTQATGTGQNGHLIPCGDMRDKEKEKVKAQNPVIMYSLAHACVILLLPDRVT